MPPVLARPFTVEDYDLLPEGSRYQLIDGELLMSPSPSALHQRILGALFFALQQYLHSHPNGLVLLSPFDVQLSNLDVFQPDLCWFSSGRRSRVTPQRALGAPDLVVEILSPRTAHYDLQLKRPLYARDGVRELWLIDPDQHSLALYCLADDPGQPAAILLPPAVLTTALLPGFSLPLAQLFAAAES